MVGCTALQLLLTAHFLSIGVVGPRFSPRFKLVIHPLGLPCHPTQELKGSSLRWRVPVHLGIPLDSLLLALPPAIKSLSLTELIVEGQGGALDINELSRLTGLERLALQYIHTREKAESGSCTVIGLEALTRLTFLELAHGWCSYMEVAGDLAPLSRLQHLHLDAVSSIDSDLDWGRLSGLTHLALSPSLCPWDIGDRPTTTQLPCLQELVMQCSDVPWPSYPTALRGLDLSGSPVAGGWGLQLPPHLSSLCLEMCDRSGLPNALAAVSALTYLDAGRNPWSLPSLAFPEDVCRHLGSTLRRLKLQGNYCTKPTTPSPLDQLPPTFSLLSRLASLDLS